MTIISTIPRTTLTAGTTINGYTINDVMAEAIMHLHEGELSPMTVYSTDFAAPMEGYLYKHQGLELFATVVNRSIDLLLVNQENVDPVEKTKALLLVEMEKNMTGQDLKARIHHLYAAPQPISEGTEEANEFAKIVRIVEELFLTHVLEPNELILNAEYVETDTYTNFNTGWVVPEEQAEPVAVTPKEPSLADTVMKLFTSRKDEELDLAELMKEVTAIRPSTTDSALRGAVNRLVKEGTVQRIGRGVYLMEGEKRFDLLSLLDPAQPTDETVEEVVEEKVVVPSPVTPTPVVSIDQLKGLRPHFFENEGIVEYLRFMNVRQSMINSLLLFRDRQRDRLMTMDLPDPLEEVVVAVREKPRYFGRTSDLEKAIASIIMDQPLVFKGEAGSGKSTMIETLSTLTNLPLYEISGSLEANKDTLVGSPDIKEAGVLTTKDGMMTKAGKIGAILSVDEVNMMRPDITAILHSFADHRKTFYNDVEQRTIVCNEFTRFVGAMNEKYRGTKELNEALKDRTAMIHMTYMSRDDFKKMLEGFDGFTDFQLEELGFDELSPKDVKVLMNIAAQLQIAAKQQLIPVLAASTRNIITIAKLTRMLSYADAISMVISKYDEDDRQKIAGVLASCQDLAEIGITATNILNM